MTTEHIGTAPAPRVTPRSAAAASYVLHELGELARGHGEPLEVRVLATTALTIRVAFAERPTLARWAAELGLIPTPDLTGRVRDERDLGISVVDLSGPAFGWTFHLTHTEALLTAEPQAATPDDDTPGGTE